MGNDGLISKAKKARDEYINSELKEKNDIEILSDMLYVASENGQGDKDTGTINCNCKDTIEDLTQRINALERNSNVGEIEKIKEQINSLSDTMAKLNTELENEKYIPPTVLTGTLNVSLAAAQQADYTIVFEKPFKTTPVITLSFTANEVITYSLKSQSATNFIVSFTNKYTSRPNSGVLTWTATESKE